MARIDTTTVQREFELRVKYIEEPSERDVGHPNSVEIVSVMVGSIEIPLTKELRESIQREVAEQVYS